MKSSKLGLSGLLAIAAVAASGSTLLAPPNNSNLQRRRSEHELEMERQKRISMQGLTQDQRDWNEAVDAKRLQKKRESYD